jgi:metallophosphoesterase (TIGR00282 family)
MKILFCGDVVGRSGRDSLKKYLPELKRDLNLDFIITNVDNAAGGFGASKSVCDQIVSYGTDVLTGGDHVWDQRDTIDFIDRYDKLLRPLNFPKGTPGAGARIFKTDDQKEILVIHILGQVFLKNNLDCPFESIDNILDSYKLGEHLEAIFEDFHAEATSEKMAMGKFLDGRISAIVGSHTHIPTNDFHIMEGGSGYHSDAGMCGDYNSIIGMQKEAPLQMFLSKRKSARMTPAIGDGTLCGTYIEIDKKTGLAKNIKAIKIGGVLANTNI